MNPATADALAALRDIHLPAAVSFWPPAAGWWFLAAILLGLSIAIPAWIRVRRRRRDARWQSAGTLELERLEYAFAESGDALALAAGLSALLRRGSLARAQRREVASLHGAIWFELLASQQGDDREEAVATIHELSSAVYRGRTTPEARPERWIQFVRSWIAEAA